jgi:hypothetical protein
LVRERRKSPKQMHAHLSAHSSAFQTDGSIRCGVHLARGFDSILRLKPMLVEFSLRCGQPGTMEDLAYFLSKPGALPREPHLYLIVKRPNLTLDQITLDDLVGALLLYEFQVLGRGVRAFATNDRSGRGTLLALPFERLKVASFISRTLLDRGAHMIMLSFRTGTDHADKENPELFHLPSNGIPARWASRERSVPAYMLIEDSFDNTLANLGKRTRRNLRYYRRLAEEELGCQFIPEIEISNEDFLAFNRETMFAPRNPVACWRYRMQNQLTGPVMMGLKDRDGRWLSILGGRRIDDRMEILWQMNREGLPNYSLSTVLRAYCIEHEASRGTKRLYLEGGTSHSLQNSFLTEELTDLVVVRRSVVGKTMEQLARRWIYGDNELAVMLKEEQLVWSEC